MTRHYVEYYNPGSVVDSTDTRPVSQYGKIGQLPKDCIAYKFFTREEVTVNGERLVGRRKNISGMHHIGTKYTLEDIKKYFPKEKVLRTNMVMNGWEAVVGTGTGIFRPFREGDVMV